MDSNPNATSKYFRAVGDWLLRILLAVGLGLGVMAFVGATAWSAPHYTDSEMASVEKPDEARLRQLRKEEITQLRITLGRRMPSHRRADLYLRLAEIYLEQYRADFLREGRVHERRLANGQPDQFIDRSHSRPVLALGIKACKDILRLGIHYDKMDQLYYFLGFYEGELENRSASLKYYRLLASRYSNSPLALEAFREIGDDAFAHNRFRAAMGEYEKAVRLAAKHPSISGNLPLVLHKLAWTYYRTKQFDRAVSTMKDAIARASENNEKFLSIREEALRDMAVFMTETGKVDAAIAYFREVAHDKSYYPKILEKLGREYEHEVQPEKAIRVYESLLKTDPDDDTAFRVREKLVDLRLRQGRYDDALKVIAQGKIPTGGDTDTQTAATNLRAMVRRTATEHHERYRKKKDRGALRIAESYYKVYLDRFLSEDDPRKETPEIQMYLADVERELGRADEASKLYRKVIDSGDKRYAKEAAALWTASLADAIRKEAKTRASKNADEPSALEKQFVDAADDLQDSLEGTVEAREAALKAAQVLAGYKETRGDAIDRLRKLIESSPKTPQALTAARLWIQLLSDRLAVVSPGGVVAVKSDEADDLRDAMKALRKNAQLISADAEIGKGKLKAVLAEQDQKLQVGRIASFEKDKDFAAAAKGYEAFAAGSKDRELAEKAYRNAIGSYVKAGDFVSALRVGALWLRRYSGSRLAPDSLRSAATGALIQGDFARSAALFELLGEQTPDEESLSTAALLSDGNGDSAHARVLWSELLSKFSRSKSRNATELKLALSYEDAHKDSQAVPYYKKCMGGSAAYRAECGARLADLYERQHHASEAKATFRKVAALRHNPSPFVGYARYRLAEMQEDSTTLAPLRLPESSLRKALNTRLSQLETLSRAYNDAVRAGGPWAVAALDRLALWVYHFADEVDHIAPAHGADPGVVTQFRRNLASVSEPLRTKAIATWKQAYEKALASELLSPAILAIEDHLADAGARGLARAQGYRGHLRLSGVPADGGKEGAEDALDRTRARLTKDARDSNAWVDYGNLLWGQGKPGLASIAYDRALSLDSRSAAALNNRAVVELSTRGEEDWYKADQSRELLDQALRHDRGFLVAKINLASLLNYYRVFPKALKLWKDVLAKTQNEDLWTGEGIALQGVGRMNEARAAFDKADGDSSSFAVAYHRAAVAAQAGPEGASKCLDELSRIEEKSIAGFEKKSVDDLKGICSRWKRAK